VTVNGSEWTGSDRHTDRPSELIYRIDIRGKLKPEAVGFYWNKGLCEVEPCEDPNLVKPLTTGKLLFAFYRVPVQLHYKNQCRPLYVLG
jgi:hypothetical protein